MSEIEEAGDGKFHCSDCGHTADENDFLDGETDYAQCPECGNVDWGD